MEPIRDASTLMLVTKAPIGLNTFMVKRNMTLTFASGNYVFPGGAHSIADRELAKTEIDFPKIAAIRECFEETGILLGTINGEPIYDKFRLEMTLRREISNNPTHFVDFISANRIELETKRLKKVAIWIPPYGISRRYRTWFFVAEIDTQPRHLIDGFEITEAVWIHPTIALQDVKRGTKSMMFPTKANLSFLERFENFEEVSDFLSKNPTPTIEPQKRSIDGNIKVSIQGQNFYPYFEEE